MDTDEKFGLAIVLILIIVPAVACSYIFYQYGYSHGYHDETKTVACGNNLNLCYADLSDFRRDVMILSQQLDGCKSRLSNVDVVRLYTNEKNLGG